MSFGNLTRQVILLCSLLAVLPACIQDPQQITASESMSNLPPSEPEITILRQIPLPGIPSASGIELAEDGTIYIISDDSPYLYHLNSAFELIDTTLLFRPAEFSTGRIPKMQKPDLECLTSLTIDGRQYLLTMGSGALPNRDTSYLIPIPADTAKEQVKAVSLRQFYRFLRKAPDMAGAGTLNLEGVAANGNLIYLLHRYSGSGQNKLITANLDQFRNLLTKQSPRQPNLKIHSFRLGQMEGVQAGFSGAAVADGKLFFTASVEKTPNAVEDGTIAGSFTGWIDLAEIYGPGNGGTVVKEPVVHMARLQFANGKPFTGKAESICILPGKAGSNYRALAVTDNDLGESELLVLNIRP